MEDKKYKLLTDKPLEIHNGDNVEVYYQIQALRDFGDVKAGDLGGFIEREECLSHDGDCWVADKSFVSYNARVSGDAYVGSHCTILDNSSITSKAYLDGMVTTKGNTIIGGKVKVIDGKLIVDGNVDVFGDLTVIGVCHLTGNMSIDSNTAINGNLEIGGEDVYFEGDIIINVIN